VTINKEKSQLCPTRFVEHCGAELDCERRAFRNAPKWAREKANFLELAKRRAWTHQELYVMAGVANWVLNVRRIPFTLFRPILSALRLIGRRLYNGTHDWADIFYPSESLKAAFATIRGLLRENSFIVWSRPPAEVRYFIFTDACDASWGYAVFTAPDTSGASSLIKQHSERFDKEQEQDHISDKETLAAIHVICNHRDWLAAGVRFFVDNTTLYHALRKGYSPRPSIDRMLRRTFANYTTQFNLALVPSRSNWADKPSRMQPLVGSRFDMRKVMSTISATTSVDWYGDIEFQRTSRP